jgi:excisionase family DNA binding protein
MSDLLRALVEELASDPVAVEQLRTLLEVDADQRQATPRPAFTVRSLATEIGRSERSVRDAIARGKLKAVKHGRGYLITAAAVEAWATPAQVRAVRFEALVDAPRSPTRRRADAPGPERVVTPTVQSGPNQRRPSGASNALGPSLAGGAARSEQP